LEVLPDPSQGAGFGVQVINWHIEEALDLRGVQVHRDDMVTAGRLQHIGNKFCRDGSPALVLLILSRVGEVRYHSCDAARTGCLARVDHDEELHEPIIDVSGKGGLEDEDWQSQWVDCSLVMADIPSSSLTLSPTVTLVSWFE
jgi:hypothetical protein